MWQGAFVLRCRKCLGHHGPLMPRILEELVDRLIFWPSVIMMGLAIRRSCCELPRRDREKLGQTVDMWLANTSQGYNPNLVTCQIDGDFYSDSVLQYCPDITNHLAEFFMCRQRDCLWVGDPTQWIRQLDGEHCKCPQCLHDYHPWARTDCTVPVQKILVAHMGDNFQAWPIQWPDSATTRMFNRWEEIWNHLHWKFLGMQQHEIVTVLTEKARSGHRQFFQNYTFNRQRKVRQLNETDSRGPWICKHLEGEGKLKGFHYLYDPFTVELTWDDLREVLLREFVIQA